MQKAGYFDSIELNFNIGNFTREKSSMIKSTGTYKHYFYKLNLCLSEVQDIELIIYCDIHSESVDKFVWKTIVLTLKHAY